MDINTQTLKNTLNKLLDIQPHATRELNDKGFSGLFSELYGNCVKYNATAKEWYVWNGKVWESDVGGLKTLHLVKDFSDALTVYCTTIKDERQRVEYQKIVAKYGQNRFREVLAKDARDNNFIYSNDLDKNKNLFNCQNGTLNLETLTFYPHNARDMLSKISNVEYTPKARSELWEKFINDIMQGDKEKIDYLQRILGYALTADTSLETMWVLYGKTTRNGKSTLVESVAFMFGDYAMNTQPQTLAIRQNKDTRQASGDIARLNGCRFLNASEPPKNMNFDCALLKTLIGNDKITARNLYEREFEFFPHFKLFVNTNYLPVITDTTLFYSGRINVLTFDRHFEEWEQDKSLKSKLKTPENISGIFNWCLEGLKKFRKSGAIPPPKVKKSTQDYCKKSDNVGIYIDECLKKSNKSISAKDVYQHFLCWCSDNGYNALSKTNFYDELKNRGMFSASGTINGQTTRNVIKGYEIIET